MPENVEIRGASEIQRKLKELDRAVAKKLARKALRAGGKPVLKEARTRAPAKTGLVRKNIRIVAGKSRKGTISVLVMLGKKWFSGKAFYGAFQNFGWFLGKRLSGKFKGPEGKERYHAASLAAGRRFIPGKHFMEEAYDSRKQEALETAQSTLLRLIDEEAKR